MLWRRLKKCFSCAGADFCTFCCFWKAARAQTNIFHMTKEKKSAPRAYIKLNNVSHTVHSERTPKAILDVVQRIPIVDRAPTYVTRRVDGARRRLTDPLRIWFTLPSALFPESGRKSAREFFTKIWIMKSYRDVRDRRGANSEKKICKNE